MKAVKATINSLTETAIFQSAETAHPVSLNYFQKEEPLKLRVKDVCTGIL